MPDANDMELVREFARTKSEAAFAELVRRHINLVHSVAWRYTGQAQDAEDVTQAVFIILAKKAACLSERTVLTGWLYETTRFTAARLLRTKARRANREQEAYMESILNESDSGGVWRQLAPHLEEGMSRLSARDRTLLALRFYENKSGAEAAALLGIREDAAHKRTARAVEKLRRFFNKRGIVLSTVVIAGAVSANSVSAAPAGMAATVTAAAAKGAATGGSTLALAKGVLKLMAWTKIKMAAVVGVSVLLAGGTTTVLIERHMEADPFRPATQPWRDAGSATPKAALESLAWALTQNRFDRAQELIQWDETGAEPEANARKKRQLDVLSQVLAPTLKGMHSFRIFSIEPGKQPNEVVVKFEHPSTDRSTLPPLITAEFRSQGGQWQAVADINYNGFPNISVRLPFTGPWP